VAVVLVLERLERMPPADNGSAGGGKSAFPQICDGYIPQKAALLARLDPTQLFGGIVQERRPFSLDRKSARVGPKCRSYQWGDIY
jgi:hypothetical protein